MKKKKHRPPPLAEVMSCDWPPIVATETRTGHPLDYVGGKLAMSLSKCHDLYRVIREEEVLESRSPHIKPEYREMVPFKSELESGCQQTFWDVLIAFLALHNMLRIADEADISKRLLNMDSRDFQKWLDNIYHEGSVTGHTP